jgi:hypothetical protein
MVTHMVLFRFADSSDAEEAVQKLRGMKGRIASLLDVEAGVDFTRSQRSYEVGLITRHVDRAALEAYQEDPVHQEVAAFIKARTGGSVAVDFES